MDEEFVINLRVDNAMYPIKIKRSEEETYRRAAREIDYKLGQYKSSFTGDSRDLQTKDYMAMTAIQVLADKARFEMRGEYFEEKIKGLTDELDEFLKKRVR